MPFFTGRPRPGTRMGEAGGGDGARRLGGPLQRGVRVRPARARRLRDRLPGTLARQRIWPLGVDRTRLGSRRAARPPAVPDPAAAETVKHISVMHRRSVGLLLGALALGAGACRGREPDTRSQGGSASPPESTAPAPTPPQPPPPSPPSPFP